MVHVSDTTSFVNKHLANIFTDNQDYEQFRRSIEALRSCLFTLKDSCIAIFDAIASLDWSKLSKRSVKPLLRLFLELFIAHPIGISIGISGLIKSLKTVPEDSDDLIRKISILIVDISNISTPNDEKLIHYIDQNIPFFNKPTFVFLNYLKFLFRVAKSLHRINQQIIRYVIKTLVSLDTQLSRSTLAKHNKILTNLKSKKADPSIISDPDTREAVAEYYDIYNTLDILMDYCFKQFFQIQQARGGDYVFELLKVAFADVLLCKGLVSVQFIWFYLSTVDKEFLNRTLDCLWVVVSSPRSIDLYRHCASIHLGGLLSRCSIIPFKTFVEHIKNMNTYLNKYIATKISIDPSDNQSMFERNRVFYVICQSMFYALVFRNKHRSEYDCPKEWEKFLTKLSLERLINCSLNPLRYFGTALSQQVSRLGCDYSLFYAYSVLERNKTLFGIVQSQDESFSDINLKNLSNSCNFPFDPYLLSTTLNRIDKNYSYW